MKKIIIKLLKNLKNKKKFWKYLMNKELYKIIIKFNYINTNSIFLFFKGSYFLYFF